MKTSLSAFLAAASLSLGLMTSAQAGEQPLTSAVPAAYVPARYEATWQSNPFLRSSRPAPTVHVSWGSFWDLTGMYKGITGQVTVTIKNRVTGETQRVVQDGSGDFQLVQAHFDRDVRAASAEIQKDGETATLKYAETTASASPVKARGVIR